MRGRWSWEGDVGEQLEGRGAQGQRGELRERERGRRADQAGQSGGQERQGVQADPDELSRGEGGVGQVRPLAVGGVGGRDEGRGARGLSSGGRQESS